MRMRQIETDRPYRSCITIQPDGRILYQAHSDRASYEAAATLIENFGAYAADEAAARAERSRELGNVIHFCQWRQVERVIAFLSDAHPSGLIH